MKINYECKLVKLDTPANCREEQQQNTGQIPEQLKLASIFSVVLTAGRHVGVSSLLVTRAVLVVDDFEG